jgi:hypothetical protein
LELKERSVDEGMQEVGVAARGMQKSYSGNVALNDTGLETHSVAKRAVSVL